MKRWAILLGIIMIAWINKAGAGEIVGGPGDRITGFAPSDSLKDTLIVTVNIPSVIGLYVNGNVTFDLNTYAAGGTYPPVTFPAYYDPTGVSGTNANGVDVEVLSNSNDLTWYLETWGSGDFGTTVGLDQLEYTDDGGSVWNQYSTSPTEIASGTKTNGWASYNQDYRFRAEADDEPGSYQTTIYYRVYAE